MCSYSFYAGYFLITCHRDDHYILSVDTTIIRYLPVTRLNVKYNTNSRGKLFPR